MKILVTGCAGMIGFSICQLLLEKGHNVVGVDNFSSEQIYQPYALEGLRQYKNFSFYHQDIITYKIPPIDAIIHLAACAGIKFSYNNPAETINNNHLSFMYVLEYCRQHKTPLFFASSSSVYGNNSYLSEELPLQDGLSIYALSKKYNEDIARMYSNFYEVKTYALRFFTVFGKFSRPDMLVHKIIDSIVHKKPLTLYRYGRLERDFTYVEDVSASIYTLLNHEFNHSMPEDKYQAYNIGGNYSTALIDFTILFEQAFNSKASLHLVEEKPLYDAEKTQCNNKKLVEKFPHLEFTSTQKAVEQTVEWYRKFSKII